MDQEKIPAWMQPEVLRNNGLTIAATPHGVVVWGDIESLTSNISITLPGESIADPGLARYYKASHAICFSEDHRSVWHAKIIDCVNSFNW